jgi:hypothetical protein
MTSVTSSCRGTRHFEHEAAFEAEGWSESRLGNEVPRFLWLLAFGPGS